jgi:hypothetical protein
MRKHIHIQIAPDAVATVSPDCSPEVLRVLKIAAAEARIRALRGSYTSRNAICTLICSACGAMIKTGDVYLEYGNGDWECINELPARRLAPLNVENSDNLK